MAPRGGTTSSQPKTKRPLSGNVLGEGALSREEEKGPHSLPHSGHPQLPSLFYHSSGVGSSGCRDKLTHLSVQDRTVNPARVPAKEVPQANQAGGPELEGQNRLSAPET